MTKSTKLVPTGKQYKKVMKAKRIDQLIAEIADTMRECTQGYPLEVILDSDVTKKMAQQAAANFEEWDAEVMFGVPVDSKEPQGETYNRILFRAKKKSKKK